MRSAEKKLIFQAEWLSVPGLGRVYGRRRRCALGAGSAFSIVSLKAERFDPAAAGA